MICYQGALPYDETERDICLATWGACPWTVAWRWKWKGNSPVAFCSCPTSLWVRLASRRVHPPALLRCSYQLLQHLLEKPYPTPRSVGSHPSPGVARAPQTPDHQLLSITWKNLLVLRGNLSAMVVAEAEHMAEGSGSSKAERTCCWTDDLTNQQSFSVIWAPYAPLHPRVLVQVTPYCFFLR